MDFNKFEAEDFQESYEKFIPEALKGIMSQEIETALVQLMFFCYVYNNINTPLGLISQTLPIQDELQQCCQSTYALQSDAWQKCINSKGKEREDYINKITQRSITSGCKNLQEQT